MGPSGFAGAAWTDLDLLTLTTTWQTVGATISVNAPADNSTALIEADGDLYLAGATGNYGLVEVRLVLDDVQVRIIRTEILNNVVSNLSSGWHLHTPATLSAGAHLVRVEARTVQSSRAVQINAGPAGAAPGKLSAFVFRP
jgi:hypothetical protein